MRPAQQHHLMFGAANAHGIDYLVSKQRIHFYLMRVHNIWFHIMYSYSMRATHLHKLPNAKRQLISFIHRRMKLNTIFHHGQLRMKLKLIKTSWSNRRLMMLLFFRFLIYNAIEWRLFYGSIICLCFSQWPRRRNAKWANVSFFLHSNAPEISHAVRTLNVKAIDVILRITFS